MAPLGFLPVLVTVISLTVGLPSAKDYEYMSDEEYQADYYNDQDYYEFNESNSIDGGRERENQRTPKFVSIPKSIMVNEGDTIKLPCVVDKLDELVIIWKHIPKGGTQNMLALGANLLDKSDTRVALETETNSNNLVISLAEVKDEGEYICQVSAYNPIEIKHTVQIRVRPEVKATGTPTPQGEDNMITVEAGQPVELECQVLKGSPRPDIYWSRKERALPSGEKRLKADSISFPVTNRKHSGIYICSADNGFGEPVTSRVKLNVQHAPEIEPEQTFIHTKEGDETEVTCIVHSSPHSNVTWYRNGKVLEETKNVISQHGNRHTLVITKITGSTHGKYECLARNQFGEDKKMIEVSGKASPAEFKSSLWGEKKKKYELEWVVESITEVTQFQVEYRKVTDDDGEWIKRNVIPSKVDKRSYAGKVVIDGLNPSTEYVARVKSKNNFGLSNYSPEFKFHTANDKSVKKNRQTPKPSKNHLSPKQEPITDNSENSVSRTTVSSVGLLLSVVFAAFL